MKWTIEFTPDSAREFKKLDRYTQKMIRGWMVKHLLDADDPRATGKPLKANLSGYWRYRIGDYRMICDIKDERIVIVVVKIGHRREVYD